MTVRRAARSSASSRPASWLLSMLERLDPGRAGSLAVVTYHRVADPPRGAPHASLFVSPGDLESHVDAVRRRYTVISAEDLLDARSGRRRLPRHALMLTFDDAYIDFATNAWPILRERSLPATLFVPTGYPDRADRWFWWQRLGELLSGDAAVGTIATPIGDLPVETPQERSQAYRALRDHAKRVTLEETNAMVEQIAHALDMRDAERHVLGWNDLRRLAAEGVAIAPHSRSHALLPTLPDAQLDDELRGSRADLERELGSAIACLAFPSGAYDQRVVRAAEAAGYAVAFSTRRGVNVLPQARWLELMRVNVGYGANSTLLRAQLGSWMTFGGKR